MPLYDFTCPNCGHEEECLQARSQPAPECEKCGTVMRRNGVQLTGFHLKGDGWAKDGYSSKKND